VITGRVRFSAGLISGAIDLDRSGCGRFVSGSTPDDGASSCDPLARGERHPSPAVVLACKRTCHRSGSGGGIG